jgi:hypothetical protein
VKQYCTSKTREDCLAIVFLTVCLLLMLFIMNRELKIRRIYECRCDERLQTKTKEFKHLAYTGLILELEHLKIETRLIIMMFASGMGECEN